MHIYEYMKINQVGIGEMVQQVRAPAAKPVDPYSIPGTCGK